MSRYLKIHHTPNEEKLPQYTIIRHDGDPREVEKRTATNDTLQIINAVAQFLADSEGGECRPSLTR